MIIEMTLVALATVYIVDVSGFTDSWRAGLARLLKVRRLRPLPPFDCGTCMAFWTSLVYAAVNGGLTVGTFAFACLLSLLSVPAASAMILVREGLTWLINKLTP